MQDHLHILVLVVAFWNAMRRLQHGQVTLYCRLKMNKRSDIESAFGGALRPFGSFLNERFKSAKSVIWQNVIWQM
jgi:hypothetical protein